MTNRTLTLSDLSSIAPLIFISGEPDTGKTTLAVTAASDPARIAFFDDDAKAAAMHGQLNFGVYHNLTADFAAKDKSSRMIDFYKMVMKYVDELDDQSFDVLIFDNWARMEQGIREYSSSVMTEISPLTNNQITKMTQFTWPYTYNVYAQVLAKLASKAKVVIITTHLKHHMIGQVRTGAMIPRGQTPLVERSSFRLYLRHSQRYDAPVGLVLKRISRMMLIGGAIKPVDVLPRRIEPCDWSTILDYINNPIGARGQDGEHVDRLGQTPTESDLFILQGTLTEDQKHALTVAAAEAVESGVLDAGIMTGSQPAAIGQALAPPAQGTVLGDAMQLHTPTIQELDTALGDPSWYAPARLLAGQGRSAGEIATTLGQLLPHVVIAIKDVVTL